MKCRYIKMQQQKAGVYPVKKKVEKNKKVVDK